MENNVNGSIWKADFVEATQGSTWTELTTRIEGYIENSYLALMKKITGPEQTRNQPIEFRMLLQVKAQFNPNTNTYSNPYANVVSGYYFHLEFWRDPVTKLYKAVNPVQQYLISYVTNEDPLQSILYVTLKEHKQ